MPAPPAWACRGVGVGPCVRGCVWGSEGRGWGCRVVGGRGGAGNPSYPPHSEKRNSPVCRITASVLPHLAVALWAREDLVEGKK